MIFFKPNIGKMLNRQDVEGLIKALKHKDYRVPREAAKALGEIGVPALERLIQALKDKDKDVRTRATWALGYIKDAKALEALIQALKNDEIEYVRGGAASALGEIGDTIALEPLIHALKDKDEFVREQAAEALGEIGDARAVEPLIKATRSRVDELRWAAEDALESIGKPAVEPRRPLRWRCPNCSSVLGGDEFSQGWAGYVGTVTCGVCGKQYPAADVYGGKYDTKPRKVKD